MYNYAVCNHMVLGNFFVAPSISLNNQDIISALKSSFSLVRILFVEILGSQCWIGLIALLCYAPLSIISHTLCTATSQGCSVGTLVTTGLIVLLSYIILSAQTILKTFLFYDYFHVPQNTQEHRA